MYVSCIGYKLPTFGEYMLIGGFLCALRAQGWGICLVNRQVPAWNFQGDNFSPDKFQIGQFPPGQVPWPGSCLGGSCQGGSCLLAANAQYLLRSGRGYVRIQNNDLMNQVGMELLRPLKI